MEYKYYSAKFMYAFYMHQMVRLYFQYSYCIVFALLFSDY